MKSTTRHEPGKHVRGVAIAAVMVASIAFGCTGKDPYSPGTKLGTFHVTAKLTQTTCGPTPDPWEFDVRLNYEGSTLYWIQGGAPISGQVDATARAQLQSKTVHDVRPANDRSKLAACAMLRSDMLAVTLASSGAQPAVDPGTTASFAGRLSYTFVATDGSDCSDQLTSVGGGFDALPCEVDYEVRGALNADIGTE